MPMPEIATSAPAAWVTSMGRYCEMRCRWWRTGVVTAESRSISPATKRAVAAMRRIRRTRMRSAATSGAGGHEAPPGQLATSSGWRSAALVLPLTTASWVSSRSPMVASGRSTSAYIRRMCRSAPVSSSTIVSWRWCRKVGGRPNRPRCSCTTSDVAPGLAKKPASRWVSSATSAPPTIMPVAPPPMACRVTSRTSSPSRVSSECAVDRVPCGPRPRPTTTGTAGLRRRGRARCPVR